MSTLSTTVRAATLGAATGGRSMTPIAALSRATRAGTLKLEDRRLSLLSRPLVARVLTLSAAAELAADKLSILPPRTRPIVLLARAAFGGLCGAIVARVEGEPLPLGALAGAAGAAVASIALTRGRRAIGTATGLPDPLVAVAEDVAVLAGTRTTIQGLAHQGSPLGDR